MSDLSPIPGDSQQPRAESHSASDDEYAIIDFPGGSSIPEDWEFLDNNDTERPKSKLIVVANWLRTQADPSLLSTASILASKTGSANEDSFISRAQPYLPKSRSHKNLQEGTCLEESKNPTPVEALTILIRDVSESNYSSNDGFFSFRLSPSFWYCIVVTARLPNGVDTRINESIRTLHGRYGEAGLLQIILWANVYNSRSEERWFWERLEKLAMDGLKAKEYLVLVKGTLEMIEKELGSNWAMNGGSPISTKSGAFFKIRSGRAFQWLSHALGNRQLSDLKR
ncbi:hypothetical protein EG329_000979 [Mollisiaceae sp. DMI_Dod_QoI]|nr:hypothetical protein EG329_000979 [Helotiales sp. DMI_Dod_QoI]